MGTKLTLNQTTILTANIGQGSLKIHGWYTQTSILDSNRIREPIIDPSQDVNFVL